ncbi:hypothetical protein E2C01_087164 [Portunus trituberculatus]|uniref:Uncharacterized protein n=1 Tax=Portunus trituberculatus TaxID=210409 RepID=A0A5B7J7E3_PORTR|nr:hypothetical protein [Portunus trituberculatus]
MDTVRVFLFLVVVVVVVVLVVVVMVVVVVVEQFLFKPCSEDAPAINHYTDRSRSGMTPVKREKRGGGGGGGGGGKVTKG